MIDAGRTKTYIRRQIVREHYVARILRPAVLQNCAVGQLLGNRNRLRRHAKLYCQIRAGCRESIENDAYGVIIQISCDQVRFAVVVEISDYKAVFA
ncbi:MAG: hypothetical protein DMG85_21150 [Acidobacteria bacterium]|nr:MAG: hypothetical protein DMG85_21150 [Acidobacteriota bacterium]